MQGARVLRSEAYVVVYVAATKESCNAADGPLSTVSYDMLAITFFT